jgi:UDP-4-amino-4,6-dideoxy-N-acetyl-beta-L-altrosamine N-acetyltransferase
MQNLRYINKNDLDYILEWRNHINVRKFMFAQHKITNKEHNKWYINSINDKKKHLLVYEEYNKPYGFMNFTEILDSKVANWGFYLSPESKKGMGRRLGLASLSFAFTEIKLHKICGQAISYNEKSIKFHEHLGFKNEGIQKDQYFNKNNYYDLYNFGLLRSEWIKN